MSDPEPINSPPLPPPGVSPPPPKAVPVDPPSVQRAEPAPPVAPRPAKANGNNSPRRDFFGDALREAMGPLAGILQQRINPLLAALEAIPAEAEKLAQFNLPGILDQPQTRSLPLPVQNSAPPPLEPPRLLRPPGAMAPGEFESVCTSCGKCVEACPARAILIDGYGLTSNGLPYIVAEYQPCVVCDDLACMKSCPTGALKLVDRLKIKMGTAHVDFRQCVRDHGDNCTLCVDACPITGEPLDGQPAQHGAEQPPPQAAIFIHAHTGRVRVRKNVCIGCGLCEHSCPTTPRAITVTPYEPPRDPIIA